MLAIFCVANNAYAQANPVASIAPDAGVITVVSPKAARSADVSGFGDVPLAELPASAVVIDAQQMQAVGARRLADLTGFDASVTDSYNSAGYWDFLTIRGFTLDNRYNYRREGLPISAETSIPLENKERVEILKGTSGIQAGTSAPGGLVNYVVKRPTEKDLRTARLEFTSRASVLGAVDLGGRFGVDRAFGYRLNVAHEELRPLTQNLNGKRDLVALATDWRISSDTVVAAEGEWSRKVQPSQAPFSLLGNRLPAPVDPRLNLNNQPWSLPSVFDALTGTLRIEQAINTQWRWVGQLGSQRLRTDDRVAFPFGCDAEGNYDRYCSNGTYDLYDFRSENERRTSLAASAKLKGRVDTAGIAHDLTFGVTQSTVKNRFQMQAYNYAGIGNVQGTLVASADPSLNDQNTNRDERSVELSAFDAIKWNTKLTTWLGLRSTSITRDSIRTNGSRATHYDANIVTPWLAASYAIVPTTMAYASYGEGIESQIVPNRAAQYSNPGVALPALKSRQLEAGLKGAQGTALNWQATVFRIARPMSNLDACSRLGITPCQGAYDGQAVHNGLELTGQWAQGPWRVSAGATLLRAKREGSLLEPTTNGQAPANVPKLVLRSMASYRVAAVPGLELHGQLQLEGARAVLPDNSLTLPAWTTLGAGARYQTTLQGTALTWTMGVDNLADKRYWKEAPYQYGHVYLFPGAARTIRLGVQASL